jgi:parvulin-like peptidyl-prolyl isomerase
MAAGGGAGASFSGAGASFSGANAEPGRRDYSTLAAEAVVDPTALATELDLQREGDQIVAVIGPEVILLSEVLPAANRYLEQNADRIPSGYMDEMRRAVVQQLAERLIQTKLILVDFRQTVPEENQNRIRQQFERLFEEEEVPRLMEENQIGTRSQLEQKLRAAGITLDQLRREFVDRTLAQQWVREQVGSNAEITHEEMLAWYVAHLDDYRYPAKVRWQQLTVHARDGRTKAEAYARLAELGNRVLAGEPFEKVAREASEGLTAADGGVNDWTSQGSLVCAELDGALFSLPVGALSRIIEDGDAFHIVRVLERQEAGRVPFRDAQVEIKKNLQRERMEKRYNDYLARLRSRTRVWTAFERPASDVADRASPTQR